MSPRLMGFGEAMRLLSQGSVMSRGAWLVGERLALCVQLKPDGEVCEVERWRSEHDENTFTLCTTSRIRAVLFSDIVAQDWWEVRTGKKPEGEGK